MLPDLDSLSLFVKAAEFHSLTRAADACHLGLAAASRRIGLLEHRMNCRLLERSPKGVEVTAAGMTLLAHAKQLLVQVNRMQADMNDHALGRRGRLKILANTSAMAQYVPADLARFVASDPDVGLVVEEGWSSQIAAAVLAGDADVGVVMDGVPTDGLDFLPYRTDRLAVVLPRAHPLAQLDEMHFSDVLDHELVALETGSSLMRLLSERAVDLDKALRLRVQVRGFEAVCRMVHAGLGLGLLPFLAANAFSGGMEIEVCPLADSWAVRRMLLCTRPDRTGDPVVQRLLRAFTGVERARVLA